MFLRVFYIASLASLIFLKVASGGWFSPEPADMTPSTIEDAECDWSLDGVMVGDEESTPYDGALQDTNTYTQNGAETASNYPGSTYSGSMYSGYVYPSKYTGGAGTFSESGSTSSGSYVSPGTQRRSSSGSEQTYYLNQNDYVGLHPKYPIGSYVTVTNPESGRMVVVQIVGRPKELAFGRALTLSKAAFRQIADLSDGVTHCVVSLT